jgi:hypothetical protein
MESNAGDKQMTEHLAEIIQRWRNGESAGLIADGIPGLTRNQVIGLVWRREIKRKHGAKYKRKRGGSAPVLDKRQVEAIRQSDEPSRVFASRFRVSISAVRRARNGSGAYARYE